MDRSLLWVAMLMDLCLASHRAILKALAAFEDGELTLAVSGPLTIATSDGALRFLDGVCFAGPRSEWIGADFIGWLEELDRLSGVGAWWRPGLRAVLRTKDGRCSVTAPSQDLLLDEVPATCGAATHSARFLVAHGEAQPDDARATRPLPGALIPAARAASAPAETTSGAPEAADSDAVLRERGLWRSTAVVPWTLGQGRPLPRVTTPDFRPASPCAPAPPRVPVYASRLHRVHPLPRAAPPPRRAAQSTAPPQ